MIKHRKERICSNNKNRSFHPPQDHCDKPNQYISPIKNGIINFCHENYINHQENIIVDEKLAIKN